MNRNFSAAIPRRTGPAFAARQRLELIAPRAAGGYIQFADFDSCKRGLEMLDEGVWAEIKVADQHLRLFSEHNAQGVQTSVYDVNAKKWIAPSEPVDDIEEGKEKAVAYAKSYLQRANLDLPPLVWKRARSV